MIGIPAGTQKFRAFSAAGGKGIQTYRSALFTEFIKVIIQPWIIAFGNSTASVYTTEKTRDRMLLPHVICKTIVFRRPEALPSYSKKGSVFTGGNRGLEGAECPAGIQLAPAIRRFPPFLVL